VRAFPIQAPERDQIEEIEAKLSQLETMDPAELPEPAQALIRAALAEREFMPEITAILQVSRYTTPSTWRVRTDRGDTSFVLNGDEDIRRLNGSALLVTDAHGIQFLIRDVPALDRESRRLLDRFK